RPGRSARGVRADAGAHRLGRDAAGDQPRREQAAGLRALVHGAGIPEEMSMSLHAPSRRELLLASGTLFAWAYVPKVARAGGRDPGRGVRGRRGARAGRGGGARAGAPVGGARRGDRAPPPAGKPRARPLTPFSALNPAIPTPPRLYQAGAATIVHAAATPYR